MSQWVVSDQGLERSNPALGNEAPVRGLRQNQTNREGLFPILTQYFTTNCQKNVLQKPDKKTAIFI